MHSHLSWHGGVSTGERACDAHDSNVHGGYCDGDVESCPCDYALQSDVFVSVGFYMKFPYYTI